LIFTMRGKEPITVLRACSSAADRGGKKEEVHARRNGKKGKYFVLLLISREKKGECGTILRREGKRQFWKLFLEKVICTELLSGEKKNADSQLLRGAEMVAGGAIFVNLDDCFAAELGGKETIRPSEVRKQEGRIWGTEDSPYAVR